MDKILDMLTEIEAEVEWSIHDGDGSEKIMALIHRAMDIAVNGKAHKWPEEKPENGDANKKYFLRIWYADGGKFVSEIVMDTWNGFTWEEYLEGYITHWWNLPEVTE